MFALNCHYFSEAGIHEARLDNVVQEEYIITVLSTVTMTVKKGVFQITFLILPLIEHLV